MVDDEFQPWMALRYLPDHCQVIGRQQGHREAGTFRRRPQPVYGPVDRPGLLVRLKEDKTQAEHARLLLPAINQRAALRTVKRKLPQNRQPVGVLACRLKSRPIGAGVPTYAVREDLEDRYRTLDSQFGESVPRPSSWGGWRLVPETVEFWQGLPNRFHDRILYQRKGDTWLISRLAP